MMDEPRFDDPDEYAIPTGDELRALRQNALASRREVASRAGLCPSTLYEAESGTAVPKVSTVRAVLDVLSDMDTDPAAADVTGDDIRERRTDLHMTQAELGELAGVNSSTVSQVERGNVTPTPPTLRALLDALDSADGDVAKYVQRRAAARLGDPGDRLLGDAGGVSGDD